MTRNVRVIVAAFLLVISLMLATNAVALANGGPHEGTFTTESDACAGCHRAHTATAPKLIKSSAQYSLCIGCHDGTGANTKVTTGVYLGTANGTTNAGLRAGGFEQALMNVAVNPAWVAIGTPAPITSRHTVNSSSLIAWGSGSSGVGESVSLTCGNCHNPHGNDNYRMLRPQPTSLAGWASLNALGIGGNTSENYTIVYTVNLTRDLTRYGGNITSLIGDWCSQCHTRYLAGAGSGSSANVTPYLYRHMTNGLSGECLRCHSAHGTSANMTGWAGNSSGTKWPDGNATQSWQTGDEGQYSRLLIINNRGVCLQCHSSEALTIN